MRCSCNALFLLHAHRPMKLQSEFSREFLKNNFRPFAAPSKCRPHPLATPLRGVSPEEEKEGYGGKDLQKKKSGMTTDGASRGGHHRQTHREQNVPTLCFALLLPLSKNAVHRHNYRTKINKTRHYDIIARRIEYLTCVNTSSCC